jgi:integrase
MASLMKLPGGRWRIQWVGVDGRNTNWRPGRLPKKAAEALKGHIEELVSAAIAKSTPKDHTAAWLADLPPRIHAKLVRWKLASPRIEEAPPAAAPIGPTVAAFVNEYIEEQRGALKWRSVNGLEQDRDSLILFLGEGKLLADVAPGDADRFTTWLRTPASRPGKAKGFSEATIGRRLRRCSQFFRAAVRRRLIAENPFDGIKAPSQENEERFRFVTREETERLIAAAPDGQWRLMIALARFGGLRTPSETLALTWGDVDWDRGSIRVPSPKTERHKGKASRLIPLFPELRPHLEEAFDAAEPGTTHVITRYRDAGGNLRTQFARIIRRGGLEPWDRVWHNLRASRQNELAATYPIHVVCRWIGNSALIANKHYLSGTDEYFEMAAGKSDVQEGADRTGKRRTEGTGAAADPSETAFSLENSGKSDSSRDANSPAKCGAGAGVSVTASACGGNVAAAGSATGKAASAGGSFMLTSPEVCR